MTSCDVLIVGAGPAGATCARLLKRGGLDVIIMDRARFPREKPCAGWIAPAVLQALEIDVESYRQGHLLQEIREFHTAPLGGREVATRYRRTVSYGIRRWEFDHYLLLRSAARHRLGEPVKSLERVPGGWLVNGSIKAGLIIGAGGHHCPVARAIGARKKGEPVIAGLSCEFAMDPQQLSECRVPAGVPALFFSEDLQGYGWLLRKGAFLNVGLGSRDVRALPRRLSHFLGFLQQRGGIGGEIPPHFRGHAYLPYTPGVRNLVGDAALLVGDAAGLSHPQSGEGILPAVESAVLAAETVLAARGDYRRERLEQYAVKVQELFGSRMDHHPLPPWVRRLGAGALLSNGWLTRRLLLDRWFHHEESDSGKRGQAGF